jgi:hypothetical protein
MLLSHSKPVTVADRVTGENSHIAITIIKPKIKEPLNFPRNAFSRSRKELLGRGGAEGRVFTGTGCGCLAGCPFRPLPK